MARFGCSLNKEAVDIFIQYVTIPSTQSGNSSVGRAQPCQGWGREFESRFPLQLFGACFFKGWVAEWSCCGLQSRLRRFDSGPSLQI